MNKYKLINNKTKEEHICSKVVIDGFEYYVSDTYINQLKPDDKYYTIVENPRRVVQYSKHIQNNFSQVVICSNNPDLSIPQIIDEVEKLADDIIGLQLGRSILVDGFIQGFNKSKELYPFSIEDIANLIQWLAISENFSLCSSVSTDTAKYFLNDWQEQKIQTIYYEKIN